MSNHDNVVDLQQRALANADHAAKTAAPYANAENNALVAELHETLKAVELAETKMRRKIDKITELHQPQIDELYAQADKMRNEICKRIRAVGGKGMRTDDFIVRLNQEPGHLVKNLNILKALEDHLTPTEFGEVYRQIPKTGYTEEFDTHALEDLREFHGALTPIGKLITEGMYFEETPVEIVIEPKSLIEVAKAA